MGDDKFWPPTESQSISRLQQNSAQLIMSAREPCKPNFGGKTPLKTKILGAWIGLSSLNDKNSNLENYLADHDEIFTGSTYRECAFVGGPMAPLTNPRWLRPPPLISEKMSITPDWINIFAPNFMGICITAMRRWPLDQKSKPKVNSRCHQMNV